MTPPQTEERLEIPFLNTYTLLCLAALAAIFLVETQRGARLTTPLVLAIGLVAVLTRLRFGPILLVATLAAGYLIEQQRLTGFGWRWYDRPRAFQVADVVLCGAVLIFVAAHYRLQALTRHIFPLDHRRREPVPGKPGKRRMVRPKRSWELATPEEAALLVLLVPVPALVGQALWLVVAHRWNVLGLPHPVGRILLLGWVLTVTAALAAALLGHWRTRQMRGDEATLYLQDVLWQETRREQRRLNRWLAWAHLRRRRKEKL